jgi:hypothetical protein
MDGKSPCVTLTYARWKQEDEEFQARMNELALENVKPEHWDMFVSMREELRAGKIRPPSEAEVRELLKSGVDPMVLFFITF